MDTIMVNPFCIFMHHRVDINVFGLIKENERAPGVAQRKAAILNRLVKYGADDTLYSNGSRFWQRHKSVDHRAVGLYGA
jgi:hypothetical protein